MIGTMPIGHDERRGKLLDSQVGKEVKGNRTNTKWVDVIIGDMNKCGISGKRVMDRVLWM